MKSASIGLLLLVLAACSPPVFDENELLLVSKIETEADVMLENAKCQSSDNYPSMVVDMSRYSQTWRNYSEHMDNPEIQNLSREIDNLVDEWAQSLLTGASSTFCKFKLENIRDAADRAAEAMAERRRP